MYFRRDFKKKTITTGIVYKNGFLREFIALKRFGIWFVFPIKSSLKMNDGFSHCGIEKNPFLYTILVVMFEKNLKHRIIWKLSTQDSRRMVYKKKDFLRNLSH